MKIYSKSKREFKNISYELRINSIQNFLPVDFNLKYIRDSREELKSCKAMLKLLQTRFDNNQDSSGMSFLDSSKSMISYSKKQLLS